MKKSQLTAINRIIKNNTDRPALKGYFINDNKYIVTDGYRAARFSVHPEGMPAVDGANMRPFFNIDNFNISTAINPPTIAELNAIIKEARERKAPAYSVESIPIYWIESCGHRVAVNAKYLKNLLNIIPAAVMHLSHNSPEISAIYITSKIYDIDGLLLPMITRTEV